MINILSVLFIIVGFYLSIYAGILVSIVIICFKVNEYIEKKKIDHNLERMSKQIDDILYHDKKLYIQNYQEGSIFILENEIQKLVLRLSDQNKQLEKERLLLKESLEDVSHQVKTPLTSLNLIVERLKDNHLTTREKTELLKEEIRLLDKIEWLIHSLLKLAQIDAHSISFKEEEIKCHYFIQKLLEPFEILMDLKDIQLQCDYQKDSVIYCDLLWTLEAVSNIVKNCIEHLEVGGKLLISISQNLLYDEIIIEDNGCGINKKDLPHLFERFYKGQNSSETSVGIGLALSKKIIESQNGTIAVENSYPGAKFTIHFYKEVV